MTRKPWNKSSLCIKTEYILWLQMKKCNIKPWEDNKFLIGFNCIYDVIWLHQVSGSSNYDDVMTKQVPGVQGANFVGRHLPSVPYQF